MKKFGIHPLFILLAIFVCIWGNALLFLNYFIAVILHEFAHAYVANKLGYKMQNFWLMPYGAGLSFNQNFIDSKDEILIASAGPLLNFFLTFLFIAIWWIFPNTFTLTENFVIANFFTGIINLLPCYPLDGGRIFSAYLTKKNTNRKKILKICFICNYFFSFLFIFLFFVNNFKIFSLVIFGIFIFLGTFEFKLSGTYTLKNFPTFNNNFNTHNNIQINTFAVNENTQVYKLAKNLKNNKLNFVYVIFEDQKIKLLSQKNISYIFQHYPATTKLNKILK